MTWHTCATTCARHLILCGWPLSLCPGMQRWLCTTDIRTAQTMMRKYVDANSSNRRGMDKALVTVQHEFPQFAHEAHVTRQVYNLPPFDIKGRTKSGSSTSIPVIASCSCIRCRPIPTQCDPPPYIPPRTFGPFTGIVRSTGFSDHMEGSCNTRVTLSWPTNSMAPGQSMVSDTIAAPFNEHDSPPPYYP